jgi:hypothetical protein
VRCKQHRSIGVLANRRAHHCQVQAQDKGSRQAGEQGRKFWTRGPWPPAWPAKRVARRSLLGQCHDRDVELLTPPVSCHLCRSVDASNGARIFFRGSVSLRGDGNGALFMSKKLRSVGYDYDAPMEMPSMLVRSLMVKPAGLERTRIGNRSWGFCFWEF